MTRNQKSKEMFYKTYGQCNKYERDIIEDNGPFVDNEAKRIVKMLKNNEIRPKGKVDKAGFWHSHNEDLINVEMTFKDSHFNACKTLGYVLRVAEKYNCTTRQEILNRV